MAQGLSLLLRKRKVGSSNPKVGKNHVVTLACFAFLLILGGTDDLPRKPRKHSHKLTELMYDFISDNYYIIASFNTNCSNTISLTPYKIQRSCIDNVSLAS